MGALIAARGWPQAVALAAVLALAPPAAVADPTEDSPQANALDPDFAFGKKSIEAKDWKAAIDAFGKAALRDPENADIQNYLGFAHRKSGALDLAFRHYEKALALNPRHRGAHEYIGETYLLTGNVAKAREHLRVLERICLIPCEELEDLKREIAAFEARGTLRK